MPSLGHPSIGTVGTSSPSVLTGYDGLDPADKARLIRNSLDPPLGTLERVKLFIMLGRPRTCIPGLLAYVFGYSYTGAGFSARVLVGALLAFLIGFSANLHNTYTDVEEDCRNLPGRGLLVARFGIRRLRRSLVAVNAFMIVSALPLGIDFFIFATLAVIGLHQYSFPPLRLKARPILGLYQFAQAVVFPFLFGWLTERSARTLLSDDSYVAMMVFLFLWFVAKGMFKNVPDFYGDRDSGLRTSATVWPSWRSAALACTVATTIAYLSLVPIVALGLAPVKLLLALIWMPLVMLQCRRLVRANDTAAGNDILRTDMLVSSGFLATLLALHSPHWGSVAAIAAAGAIMLASDRLRLDSRRPQDAIRSDPVPEGQ